MRKSLCWWWVFLLLGVISVDGCDKTVAEHEQDSEEVGRSAREVNLTAAQQEAIGLVTARTVEKEIRPEIKSFGRVIPRLQGRVQITSPVVGRVSAQSRTLIPSPGTVVHESQVLAEVEQTFTATERVQLSIGEESMGGSAQEAKAALDAAAAEYQRSERLLGDKIVSRKRAEEAKAAWLQARSRYDAALRQAEQYRAATTAGEKSPGSFPLTSPIDGVVVQVDVTAGQQVDAISPLFTVADLSTVWIEAPVFEGDLGTIDTTSPVRIYNVGEEPRFWTGQPIHAGEVVDPLKRTANLLYEVANTDGFLKLGLSVTVALPVGETRRMPMIPESAVLASEAGKGVVYVRRSPTVFVERDVTVGVKRDGFVALVGDIQVGEEVVVTGASELFGSMPGRLAAED